MRTQSAFHPTCRNRPAVSPQRARSLLASSTAVSAQPKTVESCTGAASGSPCKLAEGVIGTCQDGACDGRVIYYTKEVGAPSPAPGPYPKCATVTCGVCLTCNVAGKCVQAVDGTFCPKYGGGVGVCKAGRCESNDNDGLAVGYAQPSVPSSGRGPSPEAPW